MIPWPKSAVFSALVGEVGVEHLGDRGLEDEVDHLPRAAEHRLDLLAARAVADPGVALALAQLAADLVEELLVGPVAGDVLLGDAELAQAGVGSLIVEPLAEGGAVLERHPEVRVCDPVAKAAALELELADHELVEQPDHVRARADDEALVGERTLQRGRPAEALAAFEHEHPAPGAGQVGGGGEPVVTAPDDDRVPVALGELGDRLGKADLAEPGRDLVHAGTRLPARSASM